MSDPLQVAEGKRLADSGNRLPVNGNRDRPFFCRQCGMEILGANVPPGWYSLTRHTGTRTDKPARLGIYCSLRCLAGAFPRLQGIANALGDDWEDATETYRQRRT